MIIHFRRAAYNTCPSVILCGPILELAKKACDLIYEFLVGNSHDTFKDPSH